MTKALKRQILYASGTMTGFLLAKTYDAKDMIPFTLVGGLIGFALAEEFVGDDQPKRKSSTKRR